MKPLDLATVALGLAAIALGVFVAPMAAYAIPTGIGLIVAGLPQVSSILTAAQRRLVQTQPAPDPREMPRIAVIQQPDTTPTQAAAEIVSKAKVLLVLAGLAAFTGLSCKTTPTTPDSFFQAVVTCTESNTQNQQAASAVLGCLTGAVGGDYAACLQGLVAGGFWTVAEVACLVREYATSAATRLNAGRAAGNEAAALANANAWLRAERIGFR